MTRAVVTGGSGFIGAHLVAGLASDGVRTLAIGRRPVRIAGAASASFRHDLGANPARLTVRLRRFAPDVVFHLAGPSREGRLAIPEAFASTDHLLEACAALRVPPTTIIVSSSAVYGNGPVGSPIDESSPLRPITRYGVAKLLQEWLGVRAAEAAGLKVIVARPFNVIGPGQHEWRVPAGFAQQIVRIERGARPAVVRARNLRARRDFIDVRDVVTALRVLAASGRVGEVYNICSGQSTSVGALLRSMLRDAGVRPRVALTADRDVARQRGSATKLRRLGWRPRICLDASLSDILDDWRRRLREH